MSTKSKKTLATVFIILVSIAIFVVFLYENASNGKFVPLFTGVIFSFIPVLAINAIWSKKNQKKDV